MQFNDNLQYNHHNITAFVYCNSPALIYIVHIGYIVCIVHHVGIYYGLG